MYFTNIRGAKGGAGQRHHLGDEPRGGTSAEAYRLGPTHLAASRDPREIRQQHPLQCPGRRLNVRLAGSGSRPGSK